jgi:hypothetical protein
MSVLYLYLVTIQNALFTYSYLIKYHTIKTCQKRIYLYALNISTLVAVFWQL